MCHINEMWDKKYVNSTRKLNARPVFAIRPSLVTEELRGGTIPSRAMKCYRGQHHDELLLYRRK